MNFPQLQTTEEVTVLLTDEPPILEFCGWILSQDIQHVELIIPKSAISRVKRNFPVNSKLAELLSQNKISLYATSESASSTLIIESDQLHALVQVGNTEQFIQTADEKAREALIEEVRNIATPSEQVQIDIRPWSELLQTLEEIVNPGTRQEFERLIGAAQIEDLGALDDISVAIVAAAQSDALLNDLTEWADQVGLASKATFSRRKSSLEDDGIIYTEKVPIEVGRPKLRLQLADDISAVSIEADELDISGTDSISQLEDSEPNLSNESKDSQSTGSETSVKTNSDDILATIEQEVQDAITTD
jgi:DNA-binding Lrp family transcriptional regulator